MTCWSGFFWSSFRCLGISLSHQHSPLALGGRRSGQDTPLKNHTNPPFAADASLVLASFGEFLLQREMMMRRQNNYGAVLLWSERKRLGVFCAEKVFFRKVSSSPGNHLQFGRFFIHLFRPWDSPAAASPHENTQLRMKSPLKWQDWEFGGCDSVLPGVN